MEWRLVLSVRFPRQVVISIAAMASLGCAPGANGVRPSFPWNRNVPAATTNPLAGAAPAATAPTLPAAPPTVNPWNGTGDGTTTGALFPRLRNPRRGNFLAELMKRADQQENLAETQRKRLEELRLLQAQDEDRERLALLQQRAKERADIEQQFAEKEKQLRGKYEQLNGRASDLDTNNRDLHAQLARAEQKSDVLQDEIDLLKRRLEDTNRQLAQASQFGQDADQRLQAIQASTRRRTGASIAANSSLSKRAITAVMVPGMDIRQDGDLVRISVPSDNLFMAGTATLHQGSQPYFDQIAKVLLEHYPRQMAGVEAHVDHGTSLSSTQWRNQHQLTAAQAMAAFEQLTTRNLNPHQLFVLGHGGNHPLVSDGTSQGQAINRRLEIVVYPETISQ